MIIQHGEQQRAEKKSGRNFPLNNGKPDSLFPCSSRLTSPASAIQFSTHLVSPEYKLQSQPMLDVIFVEISNLLRMQKSDQRFARQYVTHDENTKENHDLCFLINFSLVFAALTMIIFKINELMKRVDFEAVQCTRSTCFIRPIILRYRLVFKNR